MADEELPANPARCRAAAAGLDDEGCDALRTLLAEHGIPWGAPRGHSPWTGAAHLS